MVCSLSLNFGGKVERADKQEFGKAELLIDKTESEVYQNIPTKRVDESWRPCLLKFLKALKLLLTLIHAVLQYKIQIKIYAFQYHPEVTHSEHGFDMLKNFILMYSC